MKLIWAVVLLVIACRNLEPHVDRPKSPAPPSDPLTAHDRIRNGSAHPDRIISPLPDAGPHPDYPTPVASGTDTIFTLEEPDRGAKVPTTYKLPPRGTLSWTTHAYCDLDPLEVACGSGSGFVRWRVGRRGKELIVAESLLGARVFATYVFVAKKDGSPLRRVELDSFGRVAEMLTFTAPDRYSARRPNGGNGLLGCGSMAIKLDEQRRVSQTSCLQWTGQPMRDTTGVATRRYVRDARGIVITTHFLGLDGKPIASRDGVTTLRFDLDKAGRDAVKRYRDADDRPVAMGDGCYGWQFEYDMRGLEVRRTCLDFADQPQRAANGIASTSYRYNAHGCVVAIRYAAADGASAAHRDNVHGMDVQSDARCQQVSRTCVDIFDEPTACGIDSPARTVYSFDKRGRLVSRKHYNADQSPGLDAGYQVFEIRWQYDAVGNPVRESCYAYDGNPIVCATGDYHQVKRTYDHAGREIELRYLDESGTPTESVGTAVVRTRYDNYDHAVEWTVVDADGELIEVNGMTTRRELYDAAHRRFAIILLDRTGQPAPYTACYVGVTCPDEAWHAVRLVRGIDGRVTSNQFFDASGQLLVTQDCSKVTCFR